MDPEGEDRIREEIFCRRRRAVRQLWDSLVRLRTVNPVLLLILATPRLNGRNA